MSESIIAGVKVGPNQPVRLMGVINASPESFFKGSVKTTHRSISDAARRMMDEGADFIDIGAMSTAPYLKNQISEQEEADRLGEAVAAVHRACRLPISADTSRLLPAKSALDAGAAILNDITGFNGDLRLPFIAKKFKALILMAHPTGATIKGTPISIVKNALQRCTAIAEAAGVPSTKLALDPGIGFFRNMGMPWWKWDLEVLRELDGLAPLKSPLLVGVSRKSFIGEILKQNDPNKRLAGSLSATTAAVLKGASIIRTHDVKETKDAVRLAELLRKD